jgi:hypothetical protein
MYVICKITPRISLWNMTTLTLTLSFLYFEPYEYDKTSHRKKNKGRHRKNPEFPRKVYTLLCSVQLVFFRGSKPDQISATDGLFYD